MGVRKKLKVGLLSYFPPEKDSVARVYVHNLVKHASVRYVKIGPLGSEADYRVNFKSFGLASKVAAIVEKEKIDVLHVQYIAPHFGKRTLNLNVVRLYNLGVPIVTTLHEVQYPTRDGILSSARKAVLRHVERVVVSKSSAVNVHTPLQKKFLEDKYKVKNVSSIVTGLDARPIQKRHGFNILFFGMLSPGKGVEYLIKSMKYFPDGTLKIVGSVPNNACKRYKESLISLLKKEKQGITLITKSWFSDKEKHSHFKWADVSVAPYVWGPYHSGAVQDAAEYGIPIVVTHIGAIWEFVKAYRLGQIVPARDAKALALGIMQVFSKFGSYRKGILQYRKDASWKKAAQRYVGLYRKVVR